MKDQSKLGYILGCLAVCVGTREALFPALIVVSYPLRTIDDEWPAAIADLQQAAGARLVNQVQFQLAAPDRVVLSVWRGR